MTVADTEPTLPRWSTWLRRCIWVLAGLALALVLAMAAFLLYLRSVDWNSMRPAVTAKVTELTGRPMGIAGDLDVDWHWPNPSTSGWRAWIPAVTFTAHDLRLGNPVHWPSQAFTDPGEFVEAQKVQADLQLLPLLHKTIQVNEIRFTGAYGRFQWVGDAVVGGDTSASAPSEATTPPVASKGAGDAVPATVAATSSPIAPDTASDNWHIRKAIIAPGERRWRFALKRVQLTDSTVSYEHLGRKLFAKARLSSVDQAPYRLAFALNGSLAGAAFQGEGFTGDVLDISEDTVALPIKLKATSGQLQLGLEGALQHPSQLDGIAVKLTLQGADMQQLYPLTGLVLPRTPAFKVQGDLNGAFSPGKARWTFKNFRGTVGKSDLQGELQYVSSADRPVLSGALSSTELQLADLGALIGAGAPNKNTGKVLPNMPLGVERWRDMDADISFAATKIHRPDALPLTNVRLHAKLKEQQLRIDPLVFGVAQGKFSVPVFIDARQSPPHVVVQGRVEGLKLAALFPTIERTQKSLGELDGRIDLQGQGDNVARMLATANGRIALYVSQGTISKALLDMAALNVGSIVVTKFFGADREVPIRCAIADFKVAKGVANATMLRMSTEDAFINGTGTVNLANETLNLQLKPESTTWKFFTLRTPLHIQGSLAHPQVKVETAGLIARAGAALAALAVAPVALAVVPLTAPSADDPSNCKQLLASVRGAKAQ